MVAGNRERRWWLEFLKYHRSKNKRMVLEEENEWDSMVVAVLTKEAGCRRKGCWKLVLRWWKGRRAESARALSVLLKRKRK
jgi:hypothetical protein